MKNNIWLHGSLLEISSLNFFNHSINDNSNSGLGLFLTQDLKLAQNYGQNGFVTTIEVDTSQCYIANEDEFWCKNETINKEDLDPMGFLINTPGSKLRNKLLKLNYTTLTHYDKQMGQVLVALNHKIIRIINSIKIEKDKSFKCKM